jgi:hypothetical protein
MPNLLHVCHGRHPFELHDLALRTPAPGQQPLEPLTEDHHQRSAQGQEPPAEDVAARYRLQHGNHRRRRQRIFPA